MKRVPIVLAVLTAIWLTVCALEYGFRGLNSDVESDWVVHPAWWQSDLLADWGMLLRWLAVIVFAPLCERFIGDSELAALVFIILSQLIIVVVASFAVFYVAKLLVSFVRPNHALQRTEARGDASSEPHA